MCLLVVASQVVADEPLIVGANRDEILERPSTSVTVLDEGPPRILGGPRRALGRDLAGRERVRRCVQGSRTSRWATPRTRPSARAASCRSRWPATRRRPGRSTALLQGLRPAGLQRLVVTGGRSHLALLRRLHRSRPGLRGRSPARDPRPGEPCAGRGLVEGRPGAGRPRPSDAGRRGGGGLPPRPGRPPDPRGGGTSERGQLRAPRVLRDTLVVHRPGGQRHRPAAAVGGRRTPLCHAVRGDERAVDRTRRPGPRRLSRGRAACSAADGAGRPRPRGACAGRPRSH